ncbi:hypothetical protein D3C77_427850 [compost metagenome]
MQQHHVTGQTRRRRYALLVVGKNIGAAGLVVTTHVLRKGHFVFELNDREGAIDLRRRLHHLPPLVEATVAGQMVPQHFDTVLRDREGEAARITEIAQTIAAIDRLGVQRTLFRSIVNLLGGCSCPVCGVDRNLVGVGVALEHRQLSGAEFVFVLLSVGRGNDK